MRTTKDNIKGVYPLTPMQEGLLHHALADTDQIPYMQQVCWSVRGALDCALLEKSWNILLERHDGLRTVFVHEGTNRPLQVVVKEASIKVDFQDLRSLNKQERESVQEKGKLLQRTTPFNLSRDLLMRLLVMRRAEDVYDVVWTHHHLLLDGWSVGIVLSEFVKIYTSLQKDGTPELSAPVPVSAYIDWLERQPGEISLSFWKKYLDGYSQIAEIPQSGLDLSDKANQGRTVSSLLSSNLYDALQARAMDCGVTLTVLLQCIWGVVLSRYNDSDDVVFGMVVSGRPAEVLNIEGMVGNLINTVPVRIRLQNGISWQSLAVDVQEASLLATPHHYSSLAAIQRESSLPAGLFSTIMAVESYPVDAGAETVTRSGASGFVVENTSSHDRTNYPLDVQFLPTPEGMRCTFFYDRDQYEDSQIEALMRHFTRCATACAEAFTEPVDNVQMMDEEETTQLLFDMNMEAPVRLDHNIIELFERQVCRSPQAIALVCGEERLSYDELNQRANRLAQPLINSRGVQRGDVIGILLARSTEYIVSILAILKAGAAYLPLDPDIPEQRLAHMVKECRARYVLIDENTMLRLPFKHRLAGPFEKALPSYTPVRTPIADLDRLPITDRSLIDYEAYHKFLGQSTARFSVAIQATRGCPYKCAYCHKIWPKKHLRRSPEHLFAEVEKLYDCGIRRFVFIDDIFNLNRKESRSFFEKVHAKNLQCQFFFSNGLRGDILSHDDIDLMVAAGTIQMAFALETASPRLQQLIQKELKIDKLHDNLNYIAKKYPHVILELFTMHGFPTETPEDAELTLDFIKSVRWLHFPYVFILRIFPDTDMAVIAQEHGISEQAIRESMELGYSELPTTLPFAREVATRHQMAFLNEYFLDRERLKQVLPYQMQVMDERSLVLKYDSYLPADITTFEDLLAMAGLDREELGDVSFITEKQIRPPKLNSRLAEMFGSAVRTDEAKGLRILLLDLSQYFAEDKTLLYDVVEPPLGLASLLTVLNQRFGGRIKGRIAKARIDFDDFAGLHNLLEEFKPDVIGVRTLTFYRNFFHKSIELIRQWGFAGPIIAGGPYATSSTDLLLSDLNVDVAVIGEGENTICELVEILLKNGGRLAHTDFLKNIAGIAFIPTEKRQKLQSSSCSFLDIQRLSSTIDEKLIDNPLRSITPTDVAYIIYTSGSTGIPKGVVIEHHSVSNIVGWLQRTLYSRYTDVINEATVAPLIFDVSVQQIFGAFSNGFTLHLIPTDIAANPAQLLGYFKEQNVRLVNVTPTRLAMMLDAAEQNGRDITLDQLLVGAEKLPLSMVERFYANPGHREITLVNMYGPTECCIDSAYHPLDVDSFRKWQQLPLGKPVDNAYCRILDRQMRPVPKGVFGELYIGGAGVAREYVNRPGETASCFIEDPYSPGRRLYRTGDRVRWTMDGLLEFGGRIDNQLKVRGFRIEPEEIEKWLSRHPAVNNCAVALIESENDTPALTAFVVSREDITVESLQDYLRTFIPDYMIPTVFTKVDHLPLNATGKLDRLRLAQMHPSNRLGRGAEIEKARTEEERVLAAVWSEVLGIEQVSIHDNYFALGGDSIKAITVVSRMARSGWVVTIRDLFRYPTIAGLAPHLSPVVASGPKKELAADRGPLTPIQTTFFQNHTVEPNRFNHAVVLISKERVDTDALQKSWQQLAAMHGGLRTKFRRDATTTWQQEAGTAAISPITVHDLSSSSDISDAYADIAERLHGSLNIETGQLTAAACIRTANDDRILIVVHHLVVDGISWRILLEDLAELYSRIRNGNLQPLAPPAVSFIQWANTLHSRAEDSRFLTQLPYWQAVARTTSNLPEDFFPAAENIYRDCKQVHFELDRLDTEKLCFKANATYTTTVEDLLLCALGRTLLAEYGSETTLVTLESHGREESFGLDLSRTCGWLTVTFPFILSIAGQRDLAYQIKMVKEARRAVPDSGIGYGLLNTLTGDDLKKNHDYDLSCAPPLSFNYLGRLENVNNSPFSMELDSGNGSVVNPDDHRSHAVDISCIVVNDVLQIHVAYSQQTFTAEAALAFTESFRKEIKTIIAHCCDGRAAELTPADFTYSDLTLDELEGII